MTKLYITVISIVTVVAILFGCFIHIFRRGNFSWNVNNLEAVSDTVELSGDLDTIEVNMSYAGITIEYGDDFHIEYDLPKGYVPEIDLNNGTLSIENKNTLTIGNHGWNDFSMVIVIPEGTELEKLDVKLNAGNLEIEDIPVNNFKVNCDAGNIEVEKIDCARMNVEVDAGNIEIRDCTITEFMVSADAGNIEMHNSSIDTIKADADAGNIESHNCTINSGSVETDLGNINLRGDIGDVTTKTSLGIVNIDN